MNRYATQLSCVGVRNDTIAPAALRRVQVRVGVFEQLLRRAEVRRTARGAGADGQLQVGHKMRPLEALQCGADALADRLRAGSVGIGKDQRELLAAVTRNDIDRAALAPHQYGGLLEDFIAERVTVPVIDLLEK